MRHLISNNVTIHYDGIESAKPYVSWYQNGDYISQSFTFVNLVPYLAVSRDILILSNVSFFHYITMHSCITVTRFQETLIALLALHFISIHETSKYARST